MSKMLVGPLYSLLVYMEVLVMIIAALADARKSGPTPLEQ
jgi:hypothetical protein